MITTPYFIVKDVELEYGDIPLSKKEILNIAGATGKHSFFSLDIQSMQRRLSRHPFIRSAVVSRFLPNRLRIKVYPEKPAAILNTNKLYYVNSHGEAYRKVQGKDALRYPLLVTEGAVPLSKIPPRRMQAALEIIKSIQSSPFFEDQDLGDIFLKNKKYKGMAPLQATLIYPTTRLQDQVFSPRRHITVSFAEENIQHQVRKLEEVLQSMAELNKIPIRVRMELGKKVVVKVSQ